MFANNLNAVKFTADLNKQNKWRVTEKGSTDGSTPLPYSCTCACAGPPNILTSATRILQILWAEEKKALNQCEISAKY